jgi:hypothetical protein
MIILLGPLSCSMRPAAYKATCDLLGRLRAVVMRSPKVRWSPVRLSAVVTQLVTHRSTAW